MYIKTPVLRVSLFVPSFCLSYSNNNTINDEDNDDNDDNYAFNDSVHRYGGGRTLGMAWPVQLGRVEMSPFITGHVGRHRWGSVLGRYFINSKGVAITVHSNTPLHVSINAGRDNRLCLKVKVKLVANGRITSG